MGRRIISNGGAYFFHTNSLGTSTQTADYKDNSAQDQIFYPFGQLWTWLASEGTRFALLPNSENDYPDFSKADARYYNQYLGRWLSPDPLGGDGTAPPANVKIRLAPRRFSLLATRPAAAGHS